MPATKTRKTEKTLIDAFADYQKSKKRKRRTIGRIIARRLLNKKTRGTTLAALAVAGVGVLAFAHGYALAIGAGFVAFCVLCEAWPEMVKWLALNRRMLVPFTALTLAVVPAAVEIRSGPATAFLGLAGLLAVGYAQWNLTARRREHSHAHGYIPRAWLPWAWVLAAWTVLIARFGITRPAVAVLLVAWMLWAGRYWFANRTRSSAAQVPLAKVWDATIANPDKDYTDIPAGDRLVGSKLVNVRSVPGGSAATVVLPPGQRGSRIDTLGEVIASAYGVLVTDVTIDQSTKANQREMFVLPRSPLRKPHHWKGSDLDFATWTSTIGSYIDGERVRYVWCVAGSGPWHDLIAGTTRAGKSRLLDQLLTTSRLAGGYMVDWVIDPQNGQSLPDWVDEVDKFASTPEETKKLLREAKTEMLRRNKVFGRIEWEDKRGRKRRGLKGFTPSMEYPQINLTIDEAHMVVTDAECLEILAQVGKMGSKCGIKLRLVVQLPLLSELGGSTVLRDMVASGNVIVLRTASRIAGQVAFQGALPADPVTIPRLMPDGSSSAGLGFALGADARRAPMRLDWVEEPLDLIEGVPVWHLPTPAPEDEDDVIDGEVIAETFGEPGPLPAEPGSTVVRGPGGITCADRIIQIVREENGARVARSDLAAQLLGTWKLQQITKTIRELCEDQTKPVWSDDNRDHLYYRESA